MFNALKNLSVTLDDGQRLSRFGTVGSIGAALVNVMFGAAFSISLISLAIAGYLYIMSQGDPKRLETSWRAFIWSVVSAFVALGAFGVRTVIINALGVTSPEIINNVPGF